MSSRIAFFVAVMLAVLTQATSAQNFAPTADAYVRDGSNAAKNYGKATTMQVGTSTKAGNNYDSYITFNVASAPAFAQARLRLFAGLSASGSVTATVYGVPVVSWSESKITWNNKPSRGVVAGAGTVKSKTAAWLDVDVTSYLLSERGQGRSVVSFALHTAATTAPILKANTKDASTNRPQLVLLPDKAPSISLTAPQTNSVFAAPANVAVSAAVADPDGTIAKVEFFEGGTLIGTQIGPPYSVVWTKAPPGSYMLSAKATDNSGVSTISSPVSITVDALPTVTLDSPLDGTHYGTSAAFNLSATAADIDGTIARVDFYQGAKLVGSATQPPYLISTTLTTPGTYTYSAKAVDNAGLATQSGIATITVLTNAAPTATLVSPIDGERLTAPALIRLTANATDGDGNIARVEFYQGTALVAALTQAPYTVDISQANAGRFTYTARAVDNAGIATQSNSATVTVNPAPALYYIHSDHIDTPRAVTDQAGRVVWRWDSGDPFGASAPDEDADGIGAEFILNLRFSGQYFDRETGLHYNYFRDYDPWTGRYIESDPIGLLGGLNTFAYALSRPNSINDASGLWGSIPHEKIIDTKFATLDPKLVKAIKEGSDAVDSFVNQFGDTNYMHAMRGPNQSVYSAKRKACKFIKEEMYLYRQYKKFPSKQPAAYYHLGKALHPIMDSTSPMHAEWPIWDPQQDWVWHGNTHGSLEGLDALSEQKLAETIKLIEDALNGKECECTE